MMTIKRKAEIGNRREIAGSRLFPVSAFTLFEVIAVFVSVFIINEISSDGHCNWFEGAQLMAIYLLLAGLFFFVR